MLLALCCATVLAAAPAATAPAADVEALAADLRLVPPPHVGELVASDPRFAALSSEQRGALLDAVAISRAARVAASVANGIVGFGIGSIVEGDRRGFVLTATDTLAGTLMLVGLVSTVTAAAGGESSRATGALTVGAALLVGGRIAGVILPWTFEGRLHASLARALRDLPPPRSSRLLLAPLVASATGRAAPGATLALRF